MGTNELNLPDNVICNIASYANNATLCSKCSGLYDLWQQPQLASARDAEKSQLVLFDYSNNSLVIDLTNGWFFSRRKSILFLFLIGFAFLHCLYY